MNFDGHSFVFHGFLLLHFRVLYFVPVDVLHGIHQEHIVLRGKYLVVHLFEMEIAGGFSKQREEAVHKLVRNVSVFGESHKNGVVCFCVDMGENFLVGRVHVLLHDQLFWRIYLWIRFLIKAELVLPI